MVAASAIPKPLTFEDWEALPDSRDRYEILQGELIVSPPPRSEHQDLSAAIVFAFESVVRPGKLGKVYSAPIGVRLGRHDIVQPDIVYLSAQRRELIVSGVIDGAPDLVVEILSPSTRRTDLIRKMALYLDAGIGEYWVVDPEKRSIDVFENANGTYVPLVHEDGFVRSRVIPGVGMRAEALFDSVWWSE